MKDPGFKLAVGLCIVAAAATLALLLHLKGLF
jgi:hypothetical protein